MVEDITQEKDVELIVDLHRDPLFTDVPLPITTPNTDLDALCRVHGWKFCTNMGAPDYNDRHRLFYTCEVGRHLGRDSLYITVYIYVPIQLIGRHLSICTHTYTYMQTRDFIAKVNCAYIDGRERVFGGIVYDHNRRFPVHASHPMVSSAYIHLPT